MLLNEEAKKNPIIKTINRRTKKEKRMLLKIIKSKILFISLLAIGSGLGHAQDNLPFPIVDSKQVLFYNNQEEIAEPTSSEAFFGQDAHYDGFQPNYQDNGDGTVSDLVTGLMWQKSPDMDENGVINYDDKMSFYEALAGADTFNLAGYSDWRLPSIKEMYSLIVFSGIDPSGYEGTDTEGLVPFIDTDYFDFAYGDLSADERIIDAQMASSNLYVGTTMNGDETMFGVNFADGRIKGYPTGPMPGQDVDKQFYVMYVRGNSDYGVNDFEDNEDGTITDHATGLMWAQDDDGAGMTWQQALSYAETSELADYEDWRLPNAKELQSILDYTRAPSVTNSAAIDPLFNCSMIADEGGEDNYPFYWSGTTHANWSENSGAWGAYLCFGEALGFMEFPPQSGNYQLMDVHGAGSQRSDPKMGDPNDYPYGHGPQGDVVRINNYVRLVRDAEITSDLNGINDKGSHMEVYPVPATESIKIHMAAYNTGHSQIKIANQEGKIVYSKSLNLANENQINIQSLNPGWYVLTIENNGAFYSAKFIKN